MTALRSLGDTPQVVQSDRHRASAIDQRTTRHAGYRLSVHKRWLVEKPIGWLKLVCGLRKIKLRGLDKAGWLFQFGCAAYNLIRIPTSCWSAVPQVEIPAPSRA